MNQNERRQYLIRYLLAEDPQYSGIAIPENTSAQKQLLRALFNVRMPAEAPQEFLEVQDAYLQEETRRRGITDAAELIPCPSDDRLVLWQGDITTLKIDAIVNAANSGMTGCYQPNHNCIDNAIHTFAGIQLRLACDQIMQAQGHEEETGTAKITPAFNLPAKYVLHTVGPIIYGSLRKEHCDQLRSCYESCLKLAEENGLESIAFCCISTGVFRFPKKEAAEIAVRTVREYLDQGSRIRRAVFNVFSE